jgi:hypothetical protein
MSGFMPGTHALFLPDAGKKDVDGRNKSGHDGAYGSPHPGDKL